MTFPSSYDIDSNHPRFKSAWFNKPEPIHSTYYFEYGDDDFKADITRHCSDDEAKELASELFNRHGYCIVTDEFDNQVVSL